MLVAGINHSHDAAVSIIRDGKIIHAIELERLLRVKHASMAPYRSLVGCGLALSRVLDSVGIGRNELDAVGINFGGDYGAFRRRTAAEVDEFKQRVSTELGVAAERVHLVEHHIAHARSAAELSGFDDPLVVTLDGSGSECDAASGEEIAGTVCVTDGAHFRCLRTILESDSLGLFYEHVTEVLGWRRGNDEYKVMGLAPYGDPARYRSLFDRYCTTGETGTFQVRWRDLIRELRASGCARARSAPVKRVHMDVAAALQEALERMAFHLLSHFRVATGRTQLALAGGVGLNCKLNGELLASGLFSDIYVHPAAHDAGGAVGAAIDAWKSFRSSDANTRVEMPSIYLGTSVGDDDAIRFRLETWSDWIEYERRDDICQHAAEAIHDGSVIGWVQGRSEWGPRALGNRSILADPRPAANKDIVNRLIKKREAFRPFAPSVTKEDLHTWFEAPERCRQFPYMLFTLKVREAHRALLGAVTHVDGTARVHTVARDENPRFWELIREFRRLSGVPVVLNTSFNNSAEPIIDSADDAITCFLTTGLHALAIADYWVTKRKPAYSSADLAALSVSLPRACELHVVQTQDATRVLARYRFTAAYYEQVEQEIAFATWELLSLADGRLSIDALCANAGITAERRERVLVDIDKLWWMRLVELRPIPART
jgi:carbamoyltransferase